MNKGKSIFVTAVMAIMLAVILAGAAMIEPKAYAIINPMGRIVQKGSVKGSTNIIMSPGTYWVKLGSETLRVQVFN